MQFPSKQSISLLSLAFLINGCADFNAPSKSPIPPPCETAPTHLEVDELLGFAAGMANMTTASRDEVCVSLLKSQKAGNAAPDTPLRLLIGRLLADSCGDIRKILDAVAKTPVADERIKQLILLNSEALKRNLATIKKSASSERKSKSAQSSSDAKDDEARLLREKLEAIRSMEKRLDETGEAK